MAGDGPGRLASDSTGTGGPVKPPQQGSASPSHPLQEWLQGKGPKEMAVEWVVDRLLERIVSDFRDGTLREQGVNHGFSQD